MSFRIGQVLQLSLFSLVLSCTTGVAQAPNSPIPTVPPQREIEIQNATKCETQKVVRGHYQWNWSDGTCFFVPAVSIDCKNCSKEKLTELQKIFDAGYDQALKGFGMEPYENPRFRGLHVKIHENHLQFGLNHSPSDAYRIYEGPGAIAHEITHEFDIYLLGDHGQSWYAEGLADYIDDGVIRKNAQKVINDVKKDPEFWTKYPEWKEVHDTGALYFGELINKGLTPEKNRLALKYLHDTRPYQGSRWASPKIINAAYEKALGLNSGELDYLLALLKPGLDANRR
ncbi:MAG: hypothetical protein HYW22_00500 [Candidatus Aenigmarchaeota archaeon]|nr:hypothetical protein [Candidatus Aenigmarchaeota archaeon]